MHVWFDPRPQRGWELVDDALAKQIIEDKYAIGQTVIKLESLVAQARMHDSRDNIHLDFCTKIVASLNRRVAWCSGL